MERGDFYCATELVAVVTKRSVNKNGGKFNRLRTQWLRTNRATLLVQCSPSGDIPPINHNFYQNLITNEAVENIEPLEDVAIPEPQEDD
ncbi:hypothetical protein J6590_074847 [Homalodisca vitripennis]|nr:hypothetical protein J6590_074847 [Homalodisca vitripennis]